MNDSIILGQPNSPNEPLGNSNRKCLGPCADCRFWHPLEDSPMARVAVYRHPLGNDPDGECRLNGPGNFAQIIKGALVVLLWPRTYGAEGCGKFEEHDEGAGE